MYTRDAMKERALLSKSELDKVKLNFEKVFMSSWNELEGGKMSRARMYSAFSHLRYKEDWDAMREVYSWCRKNEIPFAPVAWKKYALKRNNIYETRNGVLV
jgi:hypothetical protein